MTYDPTLKTAMSAPVVTVVCGVEILHPYRAIRLIDSLGVLTLGGQTYVGNDPDVGSIGGFEALTEGVGEEAPAMGIVLHQVNQAVAIELCQASAQGAAVKCWFGSVNQMTGQLIGQPLVWFAGEIDVPTLGVGGESGSVSFECVSVFERFFETDEGARMSSTFLRSIFPGDAGFDYITDVSQSMPWGRDGTRPALSSGEATTTRITNDLKKQQY